MYWKSLVLLALFAVLSPTHSAPLFIDVEGRDEKCSCSQGDQSCRDDGDGEWVIQPCGTGYVCSVVLIPDTTYSNGTRVSFVCQSEEASSHISTTVNVISPFINNPPSSPTLAPISDPSSTSFPSSGDPNDDCGDDDCEGNDDGGNTHSPTSTTETSTLSISLSSTGTSNVSQQPPTQTSVVAQGGSQYSRREIAVASAATSTSGLILSVTPSSSSPVITDGPRVLGRGTTTPVTSTTESIGHPSVIGWTNLPTTIKASTLVTSTTESINHSMVVGGKNVSVTTHTSTPGTLSFFFSSSDLRAISTTITTPTLTSVLKTSAVPLFASSSPIISTTPTSTSSPANLPSNSSITPIAASTPSSLTSSDLQSLLTATIPA